MAVCRWSGSSAGVWVRGVVNEKDWCAHVSAHVLGGFCKKKKKIENGSVKAVWFDLPPTPTNRGEEKDAHTHARARIHTNVQTVVPFSLLFCTQVCVCLCVCVCVRVCDSLLWGRHRQSTRKRSGAEGGVDDGGEVIHAIILLTYGSKVKIQGAPAPGGPTKSLIFIPSRAVLHLRTSVYGWKT